MPFNSFFLCEILLCWTNWWTHNQVGVSKDLVVLMWYHWHWYYWQDWPQLVAQCSDCTNWHQSIFVIYQKLGSSLSAIGNRNMLIKSTNAVKSPAQCHLKGDDISLSRFYTFKWCHTVHSDDTESLIHRGLVIPYGDVDIKRHYLNQYWLIIGEILRYSAEGNFKDMLMISMLYMRLKITTLISHRITQGPMLYTSGKVEENMLNVKAGALPVAGLDR